MYNKRRIFCACESCFCMWKIIKKNTKFIIPIVVVLLVFNYYFFKKNIEEQFAIQNTTQVVAAILQENNIEVRSTPAVYNIKDKEHINFLTNGEIRNKAQRYDQIVYYKAENILVLYRPETKSIVTVSTLVQ